MTAYVLIVSSRRPNLLALRQMSRGDKALVRPLIEVVARDDDDSPKVAAGRVLKELHRQRLLDSGIDIALDTWPLAARFGASGAHEALGILAGDLGVGAFRPVIDINDAPEDLAKVRHVMNDLHTGVCLRVRPPFVFSLSDPRILLEQLGAVGEPVERADLVLDCGHVTSAAGTRVDIAGPLSLLLGHPWRSVTVAGGSFPAAPFPAEPAVPTVTPIQRCEPDLRNLIRWSWSGIGYGDYGVDHPGPPPPDKTRPPPNLRYTVGPTWVCYSWPKRRTDGNTGFFDLCRKLVESPHWRAHGPGFSWGDGQIARAARGQGGPGGPTEWKAYSLSHHLAVVAGMLREEEAYETR